MMEDTILEVENLRTSFATDAGSVQSVRGITFHVGKGESLGIVGESGCGKKCDHAVNYGAAGGQCFPAGGRPAL